MSTMNDKFITITPIDPREKGLRACPNGCNPPLILRAVPNLKTQLNSIARCVVCGLLWEVTPKGVIMLKSQWIEKAMGQPEEKK